MHQWLEQIMANNETNHRILHPALTIRLIYDFQLEPEHIFDLDGCDLGVFIDCMTGLDLPFSWQAVPVGTGITFTSHSVTSESLLYLFESTLQKPAPKCYLLGIGGSDFELGHDISETTIQGMEAAKTFLREKLSNGQF